MTTKVLAALSAAVCFAPAALAQQGDEKPWSTSFYYGLVAQQMEVTLSNGGYEFGENDDDPTYGLRFGGRLDTGSRVILGAELGVDIPTGKSERSEILCTPADGCDATYSLTSEDGVNWSAGVDLAVGYEIADNWLLSLVVGGVIAEISEHEDVFRNGVYESSWESDKYGIGPKLGVRAEYYFGDGWSARGEYNYRDIDYDRWESSTPNSTYRSANTVAGNAIEIGVFRKF